MGVSFGAWKAPKAGFVAAAGKSWSHHSSRRFNNAAPGLPSTGDYFSARARFALLQHFNLLTSDSIVTSTCVILESTASTKLPFAVEVRMTVVMIGGEVNSGCGLALDPEPCKRH